MGGNHSKFQGDISTYVKHSNTMGFGGETRENGEEEEGGAALGFHQEAGILQWKKGAKWGF